MLKYSTKMMNTMQSNLRMGKSMSIPRFSDPVIIQPGKGNNAQGTGRRTGYVL